MSAIYRCIEQESMCIWAPNLEKAAIPRSEGVLAAGTTATSSEIQMARFYLIPREPHMLLGTRKLEELSARPRLNPRGRSKGSRSDEAGLTTLPYGRVSDLSI